MWTSPNRNIIRKLTPAWITAIATTATIMALPPRWCFLFRKCFTTSAKSQAVRAENAGVAQQQANVLVSIDTIAHDTAIAMVQVQTWQQMVETAKEQLDALTSIGTLTKLRNDEGATSLSDVVQTDARIEGARAQLMQYQASLDSSRATLMSMLGWDGLNAVSNEFPQSLARSCDIAEPDDRLVPSVLAAWAQANVAQANLDYANAQMTPTVSLEPEVRHYLNDRYSGNETRDRTQYSAWVKVQMPLYQGGGLAARRNAAGHAVESAQSTIQRTRLEVRQKLLEARSQVMSLMSTLQIQAARSAQRPYPRAVSAAVSRSWFPPAARRAQRRAGGVSGALYPAANRRTAPPASAELSLPNRAHTSGVRS